jgi:hypothetical protein
MECCPICGIQLSDELVPHQEWRIPVLTASFHVGDLRQHQGKSASTSGGHQADLEGIASISYDHNMTNLSNRLAVQFILLATGSSYSKPLGIVRLSYDYRQNNAHVQLMLC